MNRLKELRKSKGYTLKEVERKTNIPHKTYDNYEILRTEPKLATWEKLAEFYDVDPEYLVGWSDVKKKKRPIATAIAWTLNKESIGKL